MDIRQAGDRDIQAVARLQLKLMEEHVQAGDHYLAIAPGASGKWVRYIKKMLRQGKSILLVAEDNEKIVGYIFGYIKDGPPIFREKCAGYISDMYVLPTLRKRGVGQQLLHQALDFFRAAGLEACELHASVWNAGALEFYRRLGFKDVMVKLRCGL